MTQRVKAIALALVLAGCQGGGDQLTGNRGAGDSACGGAAATAFGGGFVGVIAPGVTGQVVLSPTGCTLTTTGAVFAAPVIATGPVPIQPAPTLAPMAPLAPLVPVVPEQGATK
jgi:hypothetical protein